MKLIAVILLITGVALVVITLSNQSTCPPPQVEYRFVPRTFKEEQESPIKASEIFSSMFERPTPFLNRPSGRTVTKSNINRFFISQG